jgi:hypothetical protein
MSSHHLQGSSYLICILLSDIRLPLNSLVKGPGNEDAALIIKVRKPSSREVGMWAATYAMEVDQQRRLLNGKDRALDVPTTIRE